MNNHPKKAIVLHPGDFYFGNHEVEVHTLLGSCISITLWHPRLKIGGMCHFVLPYDPTRKTNAINGRYADDCLRLFKQSVQQYGTQLTDYQAKIFGGGNISLHATPKLNTDTYGTVGDRNATAALELLMKENVPVLVAHVGEFGYRKIIFDIETGNVWVKFTAMHQGRAERTLTGKA